MTVRDKRMEALEEAATRVNAQTIEDLSVQGRNVASNMLLMYGDKSVLSATGFIAMLQQAHEMALYWLVAEGYVTLTDKALISDEEKAERDKPNDDDAESNVTPIRPEIGAYL